MEIACADCGCIIERGIVLVRCGNPDCCCRDLPDGANLGSAACVAWFSPSSVLFVLAAMVTTAAEAAEKAARA